MLQGEGLGLLDVLVADQHHAGPRHWPAIWWQRDMPHEH